MSDRVISLCLIGLSVINWLFHDRYHLAILQRARYRGLIKERCAVEAITPDVNP